MIAIRRALAGLFRAVTRKSVMAADRRGPCPLVLFQAGPVGLRLSCSQGDVAVRYHDAQARPADRLALPLSALEALEGRGDGLVSLEKTAPFQVRATWADTGVERVAEFDTADADGMPTPQPAADAVELPAGFLAALAEAGRSTSKEVGRYNLSRVMLRGQDGAVVATDGRQLLLLSGFALPWAESLLIPRLPVFEGRELPADQPVRVGLADEQVTLEVGPWLLRLKAEKAQRYPDVNSALPRARDAKARLRIDPEDARALLQPLPKLPDAGEPHGPVTLDAAERVVVRARAQTGPVAEVVLERSSLEGSPVRVSFARHHLLRALRLGFREVALNGPGRPLLCKDDTRTFVWMPLEDAALVRPGEAGSASLPANTDPTVRSEPKSLRRKSVMPPATPNGTHPDEDRSGTPGAEGPDPLAEAEALRAQLQEAVARTTRLLAALRHERRRHKAVEAAVTSLRRLRALDR